MATRLTPSPERRFAFEDFSPDVVNQRLLRGGNPIRLRPKAWDALCHLIERPGRDLAAHSRPIRGEVAPRVWRNNAVLTPAHRAEN